MKSEANPRSAQTLRYLPDTPLLKQVKNIEEGTRMGKVVEKVRLTSLFEPKKLVEVDAVIDTGATMPGRRNLFVE